MNFRRIFLVKFLLLLFPNVKSSVTSWIYSAMNESAFLSVATAGGDLYDVTWLRDRTKLVQIKDKKIKYYVNKDYCRCKVFLNGTLQIKKVVKEDSGKYTVTVYQQDGKLKAEEDTMFIVQETVPQPILSAECMSKTIKCEVKPKTINETFIMKLSQDKREINKTNVTSLKLSMQYPGTFRCVVKNQVSEKKVEKVFKCSGQLDLYLILSIAGGAVFFIIFMILLIYCMRKKKAERIEDYDEEQMMQTHQVDSETVVRGLPQPPCNPTPKQLRVQQRPLPQPQVQQQPPPPQPRPRAQPRIPHHARERP